jgi:hypothetical protein
MSQNIQDQTSGPKIVNGVNVTELFNIINAVKATPGVAKFRFMPVRVTAEKKGAA